MNTLKPMQQIRRSAFNKLTKYDSNLMRKLKIMRYINNKDFKFTLL